MSGHRFSQIYPLVKCEQIRAVFSLPLIMLLYTTGFIMFQVKTVIVVVSKFR